MDGILTKIRMKFPSQSDFKKILKTFHLYRLNKASGNSQLLKILINKVKVNVYS